VSGLVLEELLEPAREIHPPKPRLQRLNDVVLVWSEIGDRRGAGAAGET